jgi:hypothetical protein
MIAAVRGAVKMAANVRRAGCAVIRHIDATKHVRFFSKSNVELARRLAALAGSERLVPWNALF